MKLRNTGSHITTLPDGTPPKNKAAGITRWLYFLALFSLVIYLVYVGFVKFTQFEGRGQVEIEKTILSASKGGNVAKLFVQEGSAVRKGEKLVRIKSTTACQTPSSNGREKALLEIKLKRLEISSLRNQITEEKHQNKNNELRRVLEIDTRRNTEKLRVERSINNLSHKLTALRGEVNLLEKTEKSREYSYVSNPNCFDEVLRAPFDAHIYSITKKLFEFSPRGEALIVLISDQAAVSINAFISNEDSAYLLINKPVEIQFADGQSSDGVVSKITSTASSFPSNKFKEYESLPSSIKIEILPTNATEDKVWRSYDRMEVTIGGSAK